MTIQPRAIWPAEPASTTYEQGVREDTYQVGDMTLAVTHSGPGEATAVLYWGPGGSRGSVAVDGGELRPLAQALFAADLVRREQG